MSSSLAELRTRIDAVDAELLGLLSHRAKLAECNRSAQWLECASRGI